MDDVYDIKDLFALGLTSQEFHAAAYMLGHARFGRIDMPTSNIAEVLQCSEVTARRVLVKLVEIGLFIRPSRGVFFVEKVQPKRSPVIVSTDKRSPVIENKYVYVDDIVTITTSKLVEPNGSTNLGGCAPLMGKMKVRIMPIEYDDGEHLGGVGKPDTPTAKENRRAKRKRDLTFHRLVPRDQWDTAFVVKEFRHRMAISRPDILGGGVNGHTMLTVLRTWERDNGLSVQDMATAVDQFFDSSGMVPTLSEKPHAYRVFLSYLQGQYRTILASDITDEWIDSLDKQMEDF